MASGPEHYAEAERLAQYCAEIPFDSPNWSTVATATAVIAQVHATLAQTAAVIEVAAGGENVSNDWWRVIGRGD